MRRSVKISKPELSIIVPVYNEIGSLESVVSRLNQLLQEETSRFEIVIVDDGSKDGSAKLAKELAGRYPSVRVIHHGTNLGYGAGQRTGYANSHYEFAMVVPADEQFDVNDIPRYFPAAATADVVFGVRVNRTDPPHRKILTWGFRQVMRVFFDIHIRDINWVKLVRRDLLNRIHLDSRGISVDAELTVKAKSMGCRFAEVEVNYFPRKTGKSKADRPKNILFTLLEIFVLWMEVELKRGDFYRAGLSE